MDGADLKKPVNTNATTESCVGHSLKVGLVGL